MSLSFRLTGYRFLGSFLAALLILQMSGLPHFIAAAMSGAVADCTTPDRTTDRCLPFCPTCACTHLGRTVSISMPALPPTPPQLTGESLATVRNTFDSNRQPQDIFHPPRS